MVENEIEEKEKKDKIYCYKIAGKILCNHFIITPEDVDDIYIYEEGIYRKAGRTIEKILQRELGYKITEHYVREIINHIKRMTYKTREEIAEVPVNLICVKNGILNIETRELLPHNPKFIFFNKLNVEYNTKAECKKFNEFLNEVLSTDDKISLLKRFTGICLRRDTAYQKALILYGKGGQGKSVFLKTINIGLLGKENCTNLALQDLDEDRFAIINLYGKIANICPDIPERGLSGTSKFKAIVTGDMISGRDLHKPYIQFIPYAKLMFSANKIPRTYDLSDAFFDRWIFVKFDGKNFRETGEEIVNYEDTFIKDATEMSGILNWALEGLFEAGLWGFADVNDTKSNWLRYSDSVSAFMMDYLEEGSESDWILREEIYNKYCTFCRLDNIIPSADNAFHKQLQHLMEIEKYQTSKGNTGKKQEYAWKYIKWRQNN